MGLLLFVPESSTSIPLAGKTEQHVRRCFGMTASTEGERAVFRRSTVGTEYLERPRALLLFHHVDRAWASAVDVAMQCSDDRSVGQAHAGSEGAIALASVRAHTDLHLPVSGRVTARRER